MPAASDEAVWYGRLNKNVALQDSIGLGLAIAKEIAESSDLLLLLIIKMKCTLLH